MHHFGVILPKGKTRTRKIVGGKTGMQKRIIIVWKQFLRGYLWRGKTGVAGYLYDVADSLSHSSCGRVREARYALHVVVSKYSARQRLWLVPIDIFVD